MSAREPMGTGVYERGSKRVWFSWLLRFAGRLLLQRWRCVRWHCWPSRRRLRQDLTMAQGIMPGPIMPGTIITIDTTGMARAPRRRARSAMPQRAFIPMWQPGTWPPLAASFHPASPRNRATLHADRAGSAAWRECTRTALLKPRRASHRTPLLRRRLLRLHRGHPLEQAHRMSSPRRAVTSAAIPPGAAACGVRGS